ncbi:aspartic peptidase domain-containing protein [Mycena vitilis]|nr:aspartic peptidase domain-containing protein [Mycena vitilis]
MSLQALRPSPPSQRPSACRVSTPTSRSRFSTFRFGLERRLILRYLSCFRLMNSIVRTTKSLHCKARVEKTGSDIVTVAGIVATGQYFSPVTTVSSSFAGAPNDGILGLAFPAISNMQQPPFFNNAHEQGAVEKNHGSIEYHDVDQSQGFWQIPGAQATVGDVVAGSGFETVIDSGTTIMYCPPAAAKEVYAKVPGSTLFDSSNSFYSYPCDTPPEISYKWGEIGRFRQTNNDRRVKPVCWRAGGPRPWSWRQHTAARRQIYEECVLSLRFRPECRRVCRARIETYM